VADVLGEAWVAVRAAVDQFDRDLKTGVTSSTAGASQQASAQFNKTFSIASAAVAGGAQLIANSYDEARSAIVKATGESGEGLDTLLDISRDIAGSGVTTTLGEIGDVVGQLAQRTPLTGDRLQALADQIVRLSEITGDDASDSVDEIIDLFKLWEVPTAEQSALLDELFVASRDAGTGVSDLASDVKAAKPPFSALGFDLQDTVAVLSEISSQGGDPSKVVNALRIAVVKLGEEGDPVQGFRNLVNEIERAKSPAEATRIAVDKLGSRAGPVLASQIQAGRFEVGRLTDALSGSTGAIEETQRGAQTLGDRFAALRNKVSAFVAPAAQTAAVIATIATGISPAATGFRAINTRWTEAATKLQVLNPALSTSQARMGALKNAAASAGPKVGGFTAALVGLAVIGQVVSTKQEDIANATDEMSEALLTGAIRLDQAKAAAAEADPPLLALVKGLGLMDTEAVAAAGGIQKAEAALWDQVAAFHASGGVLTTQQDQALQAAVAEGNLGRATNIVTEAQEELASQGKDLTQTHKQTAAAARALRLAELALVGGFTGVTASAIQLKNAHHDLAAAEAKVTRLARAGKKGSNEYKAALADQRDKALDVITSQQGLTQGVLEYIDSLRGSDGSIKNTKQVVAQVRAMGRANHLSGVEIKDLIGITKKAIKENKNFGDSAVTGAHKGRDAYQQLPGWLGPISPKIKAIGTKGGQGFAEGAKKGAGKATDYFLEVPDKLDPIGPKAGAKGTGAGRDFGSGMASGIRSYIPQIVAAAVDAVNSAEAAARNASGSRSPSTLFAAIGADLSKGLTLGIERERDRAERAMEQTIRALNARAKAASVRAEGVTGPDIEAAFETVVTKWGGLSPVHVHGGVLDLTEATGQAQNARRRRAVLLGGRDWRQP
jgi:hypothetical protein